jgi:homoserine O-acetyltransferase
MIALLILCSQSLLSAQSQPASGTQRFADFGDLKLRNGNLIQHFRLGYRTLGKLNEAKSNAVLWPTWLGARSENLLPFVGPGNVVDSSRYFVILVDSIGNGVSTSPSNSGSQPNMQFPEFTIRDMVESEHKLVTEELHLSHLRAVMGLSMGGMQTFEWVVAYPDFMDLAIPMSGSPQSTSSDKLLWTAEIDAIELDPAWNHGKPTGRLTSGIALAQEIDSISETSPAYRVARTGPGDFDAFLANIRKNASADGGTASNQIRQRQAIASLDISRELGLTLEQIAGRVRAKLLIVSSTQDHTVNPEPALLFAKLTGASVITLDSPCGHLSFTCISVGPTIALFLSDPARPRLSLILLAGGPSSVFLEFSTAKAVGVPHPLLLL